MQTHANIPHFTPSMMSYQQLADIFVQRDELLQELFETCRYSICNEDKHFTLLIGQRGMGKTHLISMLHHKLLDDEKLTEQAYILWLREEEYGISSYLDLLLTLLNNLNNQYPEQEISTAIEELYQLDITQAEYQAERLLCQQLEHKNMLILAENLDLIFEGLETQGQQKLRALIQNTAKIAMLAAAQSLFSSVSLRSCPFFGFFNTIHLPKFTVSDAIQLLSNIAQLEGKHDLVEMLASEKGRMRIRALHHLANGNPRIYVIFSQFIQADTLDEFTGPMLKMLNELTPYYQAKMEKLPAQQRKILMYLVRATGAVTVKEIAQRNHILHQTTSSQLKKLKNLGFVESTSIGKSSYYELAEPLMRMVLSVKDNRTTPVTLIIELLRHWFSLDELLQFQQQQQFEEFQLPFLTLDLVNKATSKAQTETNPHLIATLKEFKALFCREEFEKCNATLKEFIEFSPTLVEQLKNSITHFAIEEQSKIRGKNLIKRQNLTDNIYEALAEVEDFGIFYFLVFFDYMSKKFEFNYQETKQLLSANIKESIPSEYKQVIFSYLITSEGLDLTAIKQQILKLEENLPKILAVVCSGFNEKGASAEHIMTVVTALSKNFWELTNGLYFLLILDRSSFKKIAETFVKRAFTSSTEQEVAISAILMSLTFQKQKEEIPFAIEHFQNTVGSELLLKIINRLEKDADEDSADELLGLPKELREIMSELSEKAASSKA